MTTPAENWSFIQQLCDLADDDIITSVRVQLLIDFNQEPFRPRNSTYQLLACCKTLLFACQKYHPPVSPPRNLPLILFPYATGSHLLNLLPVAREAKMRGLASLIVAGEGVGAALLAEFENVITARQLWCLARRQGLVRIFRAARQGFKKLVNLLEQLDPKRAKRVRRNYGLIFRHLLVSEAMRRGFETLLAEWKPSCVISTSDDWPFEFQLFCAAKRMGIPNAVIQHGEFNGVTSWPEHADTALVWGEIFQQKLQMLGAPASRLKICGMPAADSLFQRAKHQNSKIKDADDPVCLVFSSSHDRFEEPATYTGFTRLLQEAISLLPQVQWRIRLHPAEDDSFYRELGLIGHPRVQIQSRDISLEDAVAEADVVCTIRSTAGLQAMMMQRPVIVLDVTPDEECSVWWPQHGGGLAAKTPHDFTKNLTRLVEDDDFLKSVLISQRTFLHEAFANRGKAAASIVDYLEEQTLVCGRALLLPAA